MGTLRFGSRLLVFSSILVGLALCACNSTIKSREKDSLFATGEVGYEFFPGRRGGGSGDALSRVRRAAGTRERATSPAPEPASRPVIQGALSVDAFYGWTEDDDHQHLGAGKTVQWDDVFFPGPTVLDLDYTLMNSRLTGRGGLLLWDIASLEGILGLGVFHLALQVRSGGVESNADDTFVGPTVGGRLTIRPDPMLDLRSQWTGTYAPDARIQDAEFLAAVHLTRHLSVNGGWRWWHLETDELFGDGSDVDIEVSGPTVGAALSF
jgi:hypothetical protein